MSLRQTGNIAFIPYPFGSSLKTRGYSAGSGFRFGFNTQEKDKEIYCNTETYTATYWEYDGRLGRRWNVDPVRKPWESSYSCFSNNPIIMIDPNGTSDFYNENGQKVGSDGIANGKVYVLTNEEDIKKAEQVYYGTGMKGFFSMLIGKGGRGTIQISEFKGDVVILPSPKVINSIKNAVIRTEKPTEDDKIGGSHEEGGIWGHSVTGEEKVIDAKPGKMGDLKIDNKVSIDVFDAANLFEKGSLDIVKGTFHIHPDMKSYVQNFTTTGSNNDAHPFEYIEPTPSNRDVEFADQGGNQDAYNIVVGLANKTVYIYGTQNQNQNGANFRASYPLSDFFKLGKDAVEK